MFGFGRKKKFENKAAAHRAVADKYDAASNDLQTAAAAKLAEKAAKKFRRKAEKEAEKAVKQIKAAEAKLLGRRHNWYPPILPTVAFIGAGFGSWFEFHGWSILVARPWAPYVLAILCGLAASLLVSVACRALRKLISTRT